MFLQTEVNIVRMNLSVVLWCSCRQYYRGKANIILCGKMFIVEYDIRHVKLNFYKMLSFLSVQEKASVHNKPCRYRFFFKIG